MRWRRGGVDLTAVFPPRSRNNIYPLFSPRSAASPELRTQLQSTQASGALIPPTYLFPTYLPTHEPQQTRATLLSTDQRAHLYSARDIAVGRRRKKGYTSEDDGTRWRWWWWAQGFVAAYVCSTPCSPFVRSHDGSEWRVVGAGAHAVYDLRGLC